VRFVLGSFRGEDVVFKLSVCWFAALKNIFSKKPTSLALRDRYLEDAETSFLLVLAILLALPDLFYFERC